MKNTAKKTSILLIVAFLILMFVSIGFVLAAEKCLDSCTVTKPVKKGPDVVIGISTLPDANNNWPIVVNEPGTYSCDNPTSGITDNYPCLVWPYQCENDCELINKGSIFISNCCGNPIEILWTNHGDPLSDTFECDSNNNNYFPDTCSGYQLRLPNASGSTPSLLFWFATPTGIGSDMVDIKISTSQEDITCMTGIRGPGCSVPVPPVRVEPRVQCFQFIAETNNGPKVQTWYAEWAGTDPCAVDVWAAYEIDGIPVACSDVKTLGNKLTGEDLGDITITIDDEPQALTEALTNNSQCNEGWLRFTDAGGTNIRCYYSGGRKYCF